MWRRRFDTVYIKYYIHRASMKSYKVVQDNLRRRHMDTLKGLSGILLVISGLILLIVMGSGLAYIFRAFVPWVHGSRIGDIYWESINFGIKVSLAFILFSVTLIAFIIFRFFDAR